MLEQVTVTKENGGIVIITLNRPEAANAISVQMLKELHQVVDNMLYDFSLRCVILTGAGEKAFCAGADLKERQKMDDGQVAKTVAFISELCSKIEELPVPVIAAVNGVALGGGTELLLACDIRFASDQAQFGLSETALGIIPGAGGTQRLPRLIGIGRAKELIFTARRIDSKEALSIGLVEYVVGHDSLMDKVCETARAIADNGPIAVRQAKLAINKGTNMDLYAGLAFERAAYEKVIPTKDRLEGLQAFIEKRKPVFKGK